jgi:hypothetical protein
MLSRLFIPDTVNYMIAGYLVLTVVISGYLLSMILRWRKTSLEYQKYKKEDK